jgi:hypothetical protein
MDYFVVKPEYAILAKYYRISINPTDSDKVSTYEQKKKYLDELTKQASVNGIELMIEAYLNVDKVWKFDSDHIDFVTASFNELMIEYGLTEHKDNLLFIIASLVQDTFSAFNYLQYESYEHNQRLKELSAFILEFKDRSEVKNYELKLKVTDKATKKVMATPTITDGKLIEWMANFVINAIDSGKGPVHLFGIHENAMLRQESSGPSTKRELRVAASIVNEQSFKDINLQAIGNICLTLIPYLNAETNLKIAKGKSSSDKQLEFLYKVCVLFDLIHKEFDQFSEVTPVRYMRSLLTDTLKYQKYRMVESS